MKNKMKKFLGLASRLICLALVLCMTVVILPTYASEETEAAEGEAQTAPATVKVVVAKKNIKQGTYITDDFIEVVEFPNYNLPSNILNDVEEVMRKYATQDIYEGEYISTEQISSKKVSKVSGDVLVQDIVESTDGYLIVTDYIKANTGKDIAANLQELIDKNPKRTIYFPDGEYLISTPLFTSATPQKTVSLRLSEGAVIKAHDKWSAKDGCNSLLAIGGADYVNDIRTPGSYFSVIGGTLDGNGEANGIQYVAGRESLFRDICIKNVDIGVYIPRGINGGSSDADFEDMVIYGSGKVGSCGFYVVGHDNTFTNIRIYNTETAIKSQGGTSLYKSVYVYNDPTKVEKYENTVGFSATSWAWFTDCYAENFAAAFKPTDNRCILSDCAAKWTSDKCTTQIFILAGTKYMNASGLRADFLDIEDADIEFIRLQKRYTCTGEHEEGKSYVITCNAGEELPADTKCSLCDGGVDGFVMVKLPKVFEGCMFDESLVTDDLYKQMLITDIISTAKGAE